MTQRILNALDQFEKGVVVCLVGLMALTVALAAIELAVTLITDIVAHPRHLLGINETARCFWHVSSGLAGA
jgi:hypothetical protein